MKKFCAVIFLFFCSIAPLDAKMIMEKRNGAIWVKSATTGEVEELFIKNNYNDFSQMNGKFPRIYVLRLPSDWQKVDDSDDKHRTFIRILLPLVLKVNETITVERAEVEKINERLSVENQISESDIKLLEEKAEKYDVFTRLQGDVRVRYLIKNLLKKIDVVPPSLLISTAGIYTDWGMSRLAVQANSLYLDEVWYEKHGLKPVDDENAEYRYKMYATLEDCIAERALKLNSHINYDYFREARQMSRAMKRPPYGPQLAATMLNDSNLHNVAGLIDFTFSFYKLANTDYFPTLEDVK
jgi:Bax protein